MDYQAHSQSYRAQLGTLTQVNTLTGKERCIRRLQVPQSLWQWEGDRGWNNFDTGLRQTLERSYLSDRTDRAHSYSTHGHAYEANFVTMKQKKVSTGYVRCIRRLYHGKVIVHDTRTITGLPKQAAAPKQPIAGGAGGGCQDHFGRRGQQHNGQNRWGSVRCLAWAAS